MHAGNNGKQWEIWDKKNLTGLRRDSSFFDGTFDAERGFDRTLAKTEAPTELAQLVIVSRRTLTTASHDGSKSIGRSQDGLSWLRTSGPGDRDAGAAIEGALIARRGAQARRH